MNYNRRYAKHPRNACPGAPPVRHAPAQFQRREPASPNAWHGRQFQNTPSPNVQSQRATFPKTIVTFGTTPGYYHRGCWYNATLHRQLTAEVQQQQQQQQHVPQYYMTAQAEQVQHLPRSYQSEQVGSSSYPWQEQQQQQLSFQEQQQQQLSFQEQQQLFFQEQQQLSYQEQQQLSFQEQQQLFFQEQQQLSFQEQQQLSFREQQQLSFREQQQRQFSTQSYQRQQEQPSYQSQQLMPSSGTSQPQYVLPSYPSQEEQPQQVILQAYPYQQPQQILPQSAQQQQPIRLPSYSQQARPWQRSQQYPRTPRVAPRAVAAPQAMPAAPQGQVSLPRKAPLLGQAPVLSKAPLLGQAPLLSQAPLVNQAPLLSQAPLLGQSPTIESPRSQMAQAPPAVEAAGPEEEAAQKPPEEVVEINLGPGIHATRFHNKITIEIGLSCVDIDGAERRRDVGDQMNEALNLIRGYISRRRLPRRRRTRQRRRSTVQRVLLADKETQTVDPWESDEELSSDNPDSVEVSPSTSRTLTHEEFFSPHSVTSSTGGAFDEKDRVSGAEGNDLNCDQATKGLSDPEQPKNATKPTPSEKNSSHWKPKGAVTEPTTTIDDTYSWPPLGTRASTTKFSLAQKNHSLTRSRDPRAYSASASQRNYRGISKESAFQPKQILQNPLRHGKDRAQSNEPGVSSAPAASQAPPSRSLSSANEKMILNSRNINMDNGGQVKSHSLRGLKQNKSDTMLVAGNMFALLEEPGAEKPSPLKNSPKAAGKAKDHVDPQKLAAKRAKTQKRNLKRKERIRVARLKAQEKAATEAEATPKAPAAADNNSGIDGNQCEVQFLGEIKVKGLPLTIPKPPKFLLIPNGGGDIAEETPTETKAAKEGDPPAKIPGKNVESPRLGARKGRRSQFLETVVAAQKSPEEKEPPAKRNLWEKRK